MKKVNLQDISERTRRSPKGNFGRSTKDVSIALGSDSDSTDLSKRHPFDLALVRVPAGMSLCPYHSHSAESELYLVVSGTGKIRDKEGWTMVGPGDSFFFAPGEAHQLTNAGQEDFVYYVIADNPRSDSCYYPDSRKFAVMKENGVYVIVAGREADYFEGEE